MRLGKAGAIIIAVLTLMPWAYMFFFFSFFMSKFPRPHAQPSDQFVDQFNTVFRLQVVFALFFMALLAFYIVHLFRTDHVRADKKALWAVALFFGHFLAMPVYWWYYIWPRSTDAGAQADARMIKE